MATDNLTAAREMAASLVGLAEDRAYTQGDHSRVIKLRDRLTLIVNNNVYSPAYKLQLMRIEGEKAYKNHAARTKYANRTPEKKQVDRARERALYHKKHPNARYYINGTVK